MADRVQVTVKVDLVTETCITCGTVFGIAATRHKWLMDHHETFYCPAGHNQYYPAKSDVEKLREELSQERSESRQLNLLNKQLAEQRDGALKNLAAVNKRIAHGMCPWCRRYFKNVDGHVGRKHPEKVCHDHQ